MSTISNNLILRSKIAAFSAMVAAVTGEPAQITYYDDYVQVNFSPEQQAILQAMIEKSLRAKPGEVRINYGSIFYKPLFRVYGKYAAMLLVISFLMGSLTAKK